MDANELFNQVNVNYIHFRRMNQLDPKKLYKIYDITPTYHSSFGPGYMAFLQDHGNVKYKVQLPGKCLLQLTFPGHINVYLNDIKKQRNPFLVYRRQLPDNSYVIEIKKFAADLLQIFIKNLPVPEQCLPSTLDTIKVNRDEDDETSDIPNPSGGAINDQLESYEEHTNSKGLDGDTLVSVSHADLSGRSDVDKTHSVSDHGTGPALKTSVPDPGTSLSVSPGHVSRRSHVNKSHSADTGPLPKKMK